MTSSALALVISLAASAQFVSYGPSGGNIQKQELEDQKSAFKQLWDEELIVRLDELPKDGKVPDYRVPYSGHDYPDKIGGTLAAMAKYDKAFHRGQSRAYQHEREDLAFHSTVRKPGPEIVRRGLFGRVISVSAPHAVPNWYGHCNGWTAASIRHAEPQKSVTRNGVEFKPADIKGMLAELYMYSQTQFLGGVDDAVNPAVLHITLANWLGRNSHPVAMETALGEPVINFPIYAYKSTITKLSPRLYDVRTLVSFTLHVPREYDKGPKSNRQLYFHYLLELDAGGNIIAGHYQRDSGRVDMLWTPLEPVQGGQDGNRGGNPHLNLEEVLSIWRESVDGELLAKWVNVDPSDAERAIAKTELPTKPKEDRQDKPSEKDPAAVPAAVPAATTDATATPPTTPAAAAINASATTEPPPAPTAVPGISTSPQ